MRPVVAIAAAGPRAEGRREDTRSHRGRRGRSRTCAPRGSRPAPREVSRGGGTLLLGGPDARAGRRPAPLAGRDRAEPSLLGKAAAPRTADPPRPGAGRCAGGRGGISFRARGTGDAAAVHGTERVAARRRPGPGGGGFGGGGGTHQRSDQDHDACQMEDDRARPADGRTHGCRSRGTRCRRGTGSHRTSRPREHPPRRASQPRSRRSTRRSTS